MAWLAQDNDQPVYIESGSGAGFTDIDGFSYLDFNASDMAMFCGVCPSGDRGRGPSPAVAVHPVPAGRVRIARFNDAGTLLAAVEPGDVALVLTEPAMTNTLLLPRPGWHQALRDLTRQHGTRLALDETHTHVVGPGGATAMWHLDPDVVTIGQGSRTVCRWAPTESHPSWASSWTRPANVATGGTLSGNPLPAAAAKAALTQVLVLTTYARTTALGRQLADGIDQAIKAAGLPGP